MAQSPLADDIAFVRQMAEEGASAPTLGGRFAVWWGALLTITLLLHWSAHYAWSPIEQKHLLYVWFTFVGIGAIGQFVLSSGLSGKPGASAPGNRAANAIWSVIGPGFGIYFAGIAGAVFLRDQSPMLFNTIMPTAFLLYAAAAAAAGALFRQRAPWGVVATCLISSGLTMYFINTPTAYLIAAAGVFTSQVIPGVFDLRAEPKSVV